MSAASFCKADTTGTAVDISSMLVLGNYVTNHVNDAKELPTVVDRVDQSVYEVETVIADAGFFSEAAITAIEQEDEKIVKIIRMWTHYE
ncbi:hypothetical protein AGMMS50267_13150 [Spirochaetia bacterium]|nr:hypothetical protein AGMMS50267_13150 [Spirochaetia bacterium]